MPIYALGERTPTIHPDAFVHPDAVVIGDVRIGAVLVDLARRGAARRLRHDHRGRAHVDPGRRRRPRGRRVPDGDRRRLRDRPPRPPRGLRHPRPRPGGQRLGRAAPGERPLAGPPSPPARSCATAPTCPRARSPWACRRRSRRARATTRRSTTARRPTSPTPGGTSANCAGSRRSRSRPAARGRAPRGPRGRWRSRRSKPCSRVAARPATISASPALAQATSKTGPGSAARKRRTAATLWATSPPRRLGALVAPPQHAPASIRLATTPGGGHAWSVDGEPRENSSSPSSALTRMA